MSAPTKRDEAWHAVLETAIATDAEAFDSPDVLDTVDDYTEGAWCPRCNRELHAIGTPHVPVELLVDDELVLALQDDDETVPTFGWTCERHRVDIVLPAPYAIAPDPYTPVEADLDGEETTLAVPDPFISDSDYL
jgi:hypothetical protein